MEPRAQTATADFLALVGARLRDGSFSRLLLGRPRGEGDLPQRVAVRPIAVRGEPRLCFVQSFPTRDLTKNLPIDDGLAWLARMLESEYAHAHLVAARDDIQWSIGRRGEPKLRRGKLPDANAPVAASGHDRPKAHPVDIGKLFLQALGVADAEARLVPSMARKWKQINKFVEIFSHAVGTSPLAGASRVRVLDFGSGKGYLTFAVHDHLVASGVEPQVTGVELRDDMVALCEGAARRLGLDGLNFIRGDVRSLEPIPVDVMIALHACDTATDYAIHRAIRAGAAIVMCAPCCHKEVRPQMRCPPSLAPMLRHGVHLGQEAEMVTDSLRALLLEAHGYDTQVFEFVSLEHTSKNKMILAVKRRSPARRNEALAQVAEIKAFYGVERHCLEALLEADECAETAA